MNKVEWKKQLFDMHPDHGGNEEQYKLLTVEYGKWLKQQPRLCPECDREVEPYKWGSYQRRFCGHHCFNRNRARRGKRKLPGTVEQPVAPSSPAPVWAIARGPGRASYHVI